MGVPDTIINLIKSNMSQLQEAWDASPLAEKYGMCFPVEQWLQTILAAYSSVSGNGETDPEDNSAEVDHASAWMTDEYWRSKLLSKADIVYGYPATDKSINLHERADGSSAKIADILPLEIFRYIKKHDGSFECELDSKKRRWYKISYGAKQGYAKESDIILNYSPACCMIPNADTSAFAQATAMLNSGKTTHKVFNRIHMYPGDPNFSVGFPHLASDNDRQLFLLIGKNKTAFDDFCKYVAFCLYRDENTEPSYKWQVANDPIIQEVLFPGVPGTVGADQIQKITADQWVEAIQYFFSEKGVLNKKKTKAPLSNEIRTGLAYWAETQCVQCKDRLSYLAGGHNDAVPADSSGTQTQQVRNFSRYPTQDYSYTDSNKVKHTVQAAKLFQGVSDNPNTYLSGFWFHDIVKNALLLKSVADVQIELWNQNFYSDAKKSLAQWLGYEEAENMAKDGLEGGILCAASWLNSVKNPGIKLTEDNSGIHITASFAENYELVLKKNQYCASARGKEDAIVLLLWLAYNDRHRVKQNKAKDYVRGRMKAIWSRYLRHKWTLEEGVNGPYPCSVDDIKSYKEM